ncbi:MAG: hypothetical protein GF344_18820 [Chitinivibrionales bacterium]|nr:hypothetical protein [Chitinivibrionales bacterium]MBD3358699.1 hypothetical protein [Chitinivibrionales bacterium]
MTRNVGTWMMVFLFTLTSWSATDTTHKLVVHFFGSSTCGECLEIKEGLLKPLAEEYPSRLHIRTHDIDTDAGFRLLIKMEQKYGVPESSPQELFLPDTFLTGYEAIMERADPMIRERLERGMGESKESATADSVDVVGYLKEKSRGWAFLAGTIAAGLADGVNPCAIATMIFLISFLATRKRNKSDVLIIGVAYTGAVYVTYFAMGIGLKEFLDRLEGYYVVSQAIRWGAFSVAALVAFFSFRDAFVYARTKKTQDIKLQLPKAVKLRIHKVISGNLGGTGLLVGAIVTGFLVTLLEAVCTGQMYIPYIVAMTRHSELRIAGLAYLAFYNLLFVLPLIVVMCLAYYGMKWNELAQKTQKNMVLLKVLLGTVMTGLAAYLGLAG